MSYRERVLKAFKEGKIIYYDSEYCFPEAAKKTEWRYKPAKLRVQVFKVDNKPLEVYDVWKTGHHWDRIFQLLEEGYFLVAHNAIADVRPDLCDDRILKYLFNAQVLDTIYMERLVHGMTNPVNADTLESEDDEEREDEPEVGKLSTPFALDSLIKRYTGTIIKKTYQDARNYLKSELSEAVLEYASNDVKYLPAILEAQLDKIDILGLWDVVELNHELLASSYIIKAQGIPIDMKELARYRTELKAKSDEIEKKLLDILPRVQYTTTQLIDIYFDTFWVKGKGLCGVLSKVKAKDIVKKGENHALTSVVLRWVDENRDKITRAVNLRSSGQRLQAFNQMGYNLSSTSETVLREFSSKFHAPVIDKYLEWQKINSLLTKVLNNMTYDKYLRKDNTVPSTFTWVKALNGRSSSQDMNVQQLPRELKSLYGTPAGKTKIEYDYSAIELMKLLNDFPVNELTPLLFDDKEDIHLYNAATFFNRDYEELKQLHKQKDPVVKQLRNAAKTVIYFLQYKTPKYAEDKYVTGTNKLIEIFNNGLDWQLEKEAAESLIITGERILHRWTTEKINMDKDIIKLANSNILLDSVLLSHIKNSKEDIDMAINEGIIYFHGALNMFYKFDLLQDSIYSPEKTEWDESREEYRLRREYINNRSLYSCRIAGPVAIAAKQAVRKAQKILHERFGYQHAWIGLFVHDSMTAYCHKDIASQVDEIVRVCMLEEMYNIAGFSNVPVYIEGAIDGEPEKKYGYHDGKIMTF